MKAIDATTGAPSALALVGTCLARYDNNPNAVPAAEKGTASCPYSIPKGPVDIELAITALNTKGEPLNTFNGPVSFRVIPGNLSRRLRPRWTTLTNGEGTGTVRASHLYGEVRAWVQDEPPQVDFTDGGVGGDPASCRRRAAARTATPRAWRRPCSFEEPTLATVQEPDSYNDNRGSPFAGQFLTVGRKPESGAPLVQSCPPGSTRGIPPRRIPTTASW